MDKTGYTPNGEVQGDEGQLPMRGTGTGFTPIAGLHESQAGFDLSQDATNSGKKISSLTKSDAIED